MKIKQTSAYILKYFAVFIPFLLASCLGGGGGGDAGTTSSSSPSASTCLSITYSAPSGAANNITFNFDKPYQCGRFANGDWWASVDATGFVKIVSITPNFSGGKHGYEVNPASITQQGFDIDADGPTYNAALVPALPSNVAGISSVVKAVSILPTPAPGNRPKIQFAAVLTVLGTPLANSEEYFRPTYVGGTATKTFFKVSDVRAGLMPKWPATGILTGASPTIADVATRYAGVRVDHIVTFTGRDIHPKDSMPDYGAELATQNADHLLRLTLDDFNYAIPVHKQALINYLQMAIDLEGMVKNGTVWNTGGGHSNGRKLPLAFAAWIFSDGSKFATAIDTGQFDEDLQVFRSPVTGKVLYGSAGSEFEYWQHTMTGAGKRYIRDFYGLIDGGGNEVGDAYQLCCTSMPWKYTALAVYRLGIAAQFKNALVPEYVERWVASGTIAAPDSCATYDGIPANYGVTFGPNGAGGCIAGPGRWPAMHGTNADGGFYRSNFGDAYWVWHKANP
jgi:hypothetical protein